MKYFILSLFILNFSCAIAYDFELEAKSLVVDLKESLIKIFRIKYLKTGQLKQCLFVISM